MSDKKQTLEIFTQTEMDSLLKANKKLKEEYRHSNNGYTKDKTWRHVARIYLPMFNGNGFGKKYFSNESDKDSFNKNTDLFLKKYPEFLVVDKR